MFGWGSRPVSTFEGYSPMLLRSMFLGGNAGSGTIDPTKPLDGTATTFGVHYIPLMIPYAVRCYGFVLFTDTASLPATHTTSAGADDARMKLQLYNVDTNAQNLMKPKGKVTGVGGEWTILSAANTPATQTLRVGNPPNRTAGYENLYCTRASGCFVQTFAQQNISPGRYLLGCAIENDKIAAGWAWRSIGRQEYGPFGWQESIPGGGATYAAFNWQDTPSGTWIDGANNPETRTHCGAWLEVGVLCNP